MGQTSPDLLPWPPGYAGVPADVPNDIQKLATATQTALNKKMAVTPSTSAFTGNTGWNVAANSIIRNGKMVMTTGFVTRASTITVADNGEYVVAYVPENFRPVANVYTTCSWQCLNTDLNPDKAQVMATTLRIDTSNGAVTVVANVNGQLRATGGDYVSLSGLCWFTS